MDTAFFLVRRHPNVYLDISGIPPKNLLKYFPRVEQIADKTLFGTDWPGPGVPEIKQNLEDFRALPLAESAKQQSFGRSGLGLWPNWLAGGIWLALYPLSHRDDVQDQQQRHGK